ncbi:MAG: hypothetical protein ACFFFC_04960 [Candidatus Thorarchaeota archaeon]
MLTFALESDKIERTLEIMTRYYSSIYRDFILDGNQLIAGIIVKEDMPHTITTIIRIGEEPSLYNVTIIATGGFRGLFRQSELSRLELATKDFIENHIEFLKSRERMVWPCSKCGKSYTYPALSADGRYRCPACASPVDGQ